MAANRTVFYPLSVLKPVTIVRWPLVPIPGSGATAVPPEPGPTPDTGVSGDDLDVWPGQGPPPTPPPPGIEVGDTWIDLATGDVYVLNPEE